MKKVRKAIIPAAGLGTRFLQATKALPKEMLPIVSEQQGVYDYEFEGKRYDVGETLGFVLTNIEMALKNNDLRDDVLAGIKQILEINKLPLVQG